MRYATCLCAVFAVCLMSGCGFYRMHTYQKSNLARLEIGMSKADAIAVLGEPLEVRASGTMKDGSILEGHEYAMYSRSDQYVWGIASFGILWLIPPAGPEQQYWVLYRDGRLWRWGHPVDLQSSPDIVKEIRLR